MNMMAGLPVVQGQWIDPVGAPAARLRRRTRNAFILVAALLFGVFGLSAVLQIGGAVIGVGALAAESKVKTLIHPIGGVLQTLYVHDGDRVRQGQPLLKFDTSVSSVGASEANESLDQLIARQARLEALREDLPTLTFPAALARRTDPVAIEVMTRERRLFELKQRELHGKVALLGERVNQYDEQIHSYQAQIDASQRQSGLIKPELDNVRDLYKRNLVTITRLNQLERTAVDLGGQRAALQANIAEARARISEAREQMLSLAQTARADAATELAQVLAQISDQTVRRATANDTFGRSILRAPQAGVVDKLAYTTVGSAVPAGQPIMQIVPVQDRLVIEGRISPNDVDQLRLGQSARVSFSSLNRQVTPEEDGKLVFISAEPSEDTHTGQSYFRVRVELDNARVARDIKVPLVSGMPAEIFVRTGTRSILSYVLKPLSDQLSHAMREE